MGGAGGGAGATATSGPPSSFYTRATPGAALAPPPSGMPGATGMPRGPMSSAPKMYDPSKTGRPIKQRSDPAAVPEGFRAGQWDASSGAAAADNAAVGLMPTAAGGAAATLDPARQCGDEYMQLTTAQIPNTATLTTKSCIPLGVTVQPLAERPGEPSLPVWCGSLLCTEVPSLTLLCFVSHSWLTLALQELCAVAAAVPTSTPLCASRTAAVRNSHFLDPLLTVFSSRPFRLF